ncbi:unnamed protein product, partial [Hapterophycus canaliculatus]
GGGGGGGGASVLFVRESKLMEALRSALPDDVTFIEAHLEDVAWGEGSAEGGNDRTVAVEGSNTPSSSSKNNDSEDGSRWTAEFDLMVGADGSESAVRDRVASMGEKGDGAAPSDKRDGRELSGPAKTTGASEEIDAAIELASPKRRGYTVYRGVVCSSGSPSSAAAGAGPANDTAADLAGQGDGGHDEAGWGLASFQTWGPGLRFASVPLAGSERMWFATVAD